MTTTTPERTAREKAAEIARLNDAARNQRLGNSRVVFTRTLLDTLVTDDCPANKRALRGLLQQAAILGKMGEATFTPDNDPHGEHDFGALEHHGHKIFWKIDVYQNDGTFQWGAKQPRDEATSFRIVTVMLASDY